MSATALSEPLELRAPSQTDQTLQCLLDMLNQVIYQADVQENAGRDILSSDPCFQSTSSATELDHISTREMVYRRIVKLMQRCERVPAPVAVEIDQVHVNYKVMLGVGSYATVYRGTFRGEDAAIKVPHNGRRCSRKAILKELAFGLLLHHPYILQSLGTFDFSIPRIITPFMDHGHIGSYIRSVKLELPDIYRLISEIAAGVSFMHGLKIVHGDLRVPNVLVDKDGHVRISDFGKSGFDGSTAPSSAADMLGAPGYIAPELAVAPDDSDWDHPKEPPRPSLASDIFAFGSLCYEIFVGRPPFHGMFPPCVYVWVYRGRRSPKEPEIPDNIWNLICACWRQHPHERPTMQDVIHDIQRTQSGRM